MALNQGLPPGQAFDNTNGTLRKEIRNDLLDQISDIDSFKRTANSLAISDNFHLDARLMTAAPHLGSCEVDVQFRRGTKGTVAQIMLHPDAISLADAKTGIINSASDGHIWIVT